MVELGGDIDSRSPMRSDADGVGSSRHRRRFSHSPCFILFEALSFEFAFVIMAPRKSIRRRNRSPDAVEDNGDHDMAPPDSPGALKTESEAKLEEDAALDLEQEIWNSVRDEQYEGI